MISFVHSWLIVDDNTDKQSPYQKTGSMCPPLRDGGRTSPQAQPRLPEVSLFLCFGAENGGILGTLTLISLSRGTGSSSKDATGGTEIISLPNCRIQTGQYRS